MSWKESTIGDVLSVIKNGINCEQNKNLVGSKITRIETISKKRIDFERVGYANLSESEKLKSQLKVGDILFSHINSPIHVGKTAIYEGEEDIYHGINLLLMRTKEEIHPYFFNHFLNHLFSTGYWEENCKKSVNQASVNQQDISKVPFRYPPLSAQQKIVAKLDAIFAEIDKATAAAEANARNAEALFQSYLTELFERGGKGWERKTIEEITDKTKNVSPDKSPNIEFTYVDVSSISNISYSIISTQKLLGKDAPSRAKKNIITNDILFATVRPTLKRIAIVPEFLENQVASTGYVVLRTNKKNYHKFLFYFLFTSTFNEAMESLQRGANYPAVTDSDVKLQKLLVPSYEEQYKISEKLEQINSSISIKINSELRKIEELKALKQAILQKAFNGELVKD